ncbi:uncharacterized protein PAC_18098 [Phialocephala subalpina]|uniref:Uncharacterized protein n=1 Tax=Phialocephala subalpina TaxID=576137 RepID=A0A1L7XT51_9HELO|nr:uncharacterized protein PAC_18098 [Phialocephala subalpina]
MESGYKTVLSLDNFLLSQTPQQPRFTERVKRIATMSFSQQDLYQGLPGASAPPNANANAPSAINNGENDAHVAAPVLYRHRRPSQVNYRLHQHQHQHMYGQPVAPSQSLFPVQPLSSYNTPSLSQTPGNESVSSTSSVNIQDAVRLYQEHYNVSQNVSAPTGQSGSQMSQPHPNNGQALPQPSDPAWVFCCADIMPGGDLFYPSTRYLYTHHHLAMILSILIKNPNRPTQSPANHFDDQVANAEWLISISNIIEHAPVPNNLADSNGSAGNQSHLENTNYYISGYNPAYWQNGFIRLASQEDLGAIGARMKELDFDGFEFLRVGCKTHGKDFAVKIWGMEQWVERELEVSRDVKKYEDGVRARRAAENADGLGAANTPDY